MPVRGPAASAAVAVQRVDQGKGPSRMKRLRQRQGKFLGGSRSSRLQWNHVGKTMP